MKCATKYSHFKKKKKPTKKNPQKTSQVFHDSRTNYVYQEGEISIGAGINEPGAEHLLAAVNIFPH